MITDTLEIGGEKETEGLLFKSKITTIMDKKNHDHVPKGKKGRRKNELNLLHIFYSLGLVNGPD